ncbi:MAG: hypothetical protein ACI4NL_00525 [Christensenellales bacterium]
MKRIFSLILCILLICSMTCAYALNWTDVTETECTEYTLTATKYAKVDSDVGSAFEVAPKAAAKIGDTVYFAVSAVDTAGNEVDAEVEYHNLGNIEVIGGGKLYKAKVVGSSPWVEISITEKTDIKDITYNGEAILVTETSVTIGDLIFTRQINGKVTDVTSNENTAEMLKDLALLGINVADIYDGKICMSDDILISNFGKVCETKAKAAWSVEEEVVMGIPKTGDASIIFPILAVIGVVAIAVPWNKR